MAPIVDMKNITKRFPGVLANDQANLTVEAWQSDRSRPVATAVMNILMV